MGNSLLTTRRVTAILIVVLASVGSLMGLAPTAGAEGVFSGRCTLDLTITFYGAPPTLLGASPAYQIKADPTRSTCAFLPDGAPIALTLANGSAGITGGTSATRCGVLAGVGSWNQIFDLGGMTDGSHVLAGSWLAGAIYVTSFTSSSFDPVHFNGVIALVPYDVNEMLTKIDQCSAGQAVTSIHMTGTEVWNDPS